MNNHGHTETKRDEQYYIENPAAMMAEHPNMYKWVQAPVTVLGLWLITSPLIFNYKSNTQLWADIITGIVMIGIATYTILNPKRAWISYGNALLGVWLILSPLFFWAPNAATYMNNTLIGSLLITFSLVIPMSMPMPGPDVPPGWSYNPSTWIQRAPIIVLGLIGFFLARPMAGYQLGYIDWVWEPFFSGTNGNGTETILTSDVSKAWPVSDAGLGAATYLIELLSTFMGDSKRWRTMPWMVAIFGLAVIPLGVTSIILVIMQPVVVGTWCTLCLITATAMLLMVPLALDEVIAMIQFLNHSKKQGKSVWRTFWIGGTLSDAGTIPRKDRRPSWNIPSMLWGATQSWNLILCIVIGIWLMVSPDIFEGPKSFSNSLHFSGALIVTFSTIALAEVGRSARFLNCFLALWLVISSAFLNIEYNMALINAVFMGTILFPLSLPLGKIRDQYGTFNHWVSWIPGKNKFNKRRNPKWKARHP